MKDCRCPGDFSVKLQAGLANYGAVIHYLQERQAMLLPPVDALANDALRSALAELGGSGYNNQMVLREASHAPATVLFLGQVGVVALMEAFDKPRNWWQGSEDVNARSIMTYLLTPDGSYELAATTVSATNPLDINKAWVKELLGWATPDPCPDLIPGSVRVASLDSSLQIENYLWGPDSTLEIATFSGSA